MNRNMTPGYHQRIVLTIALALLYACGKPPEPEPYQKTEQRRDFMPDEFGIGRAHTKDSRCNRDIDALLNEVRACYNASSPRDCTAVQERNSDRIARLKNSARCMR